MKTEKGLPGVYMTFEKYAENLEKTMVRQLKLVNRFYSAEEKIKTALVERNWPLLEKQLQNIGEISVKIEEAEEVRNNTYQAMKIYCGEDRPESFYVFISKYCPDRQEKLTQLFRELKTGISKVETLTHRIDVYINTVTAAVKQVLDEVFPQRRGTIYDSRGADRSVMQPPVVIDREL